MSDFSSEVSSITLKNSTNQLQLGNPDFLGNTTILSCPVPASSRTYTIPDAGQNANLVLSQGLQTLSGTYIFPSNVEFTQSTNQVSFQAGGSGAITTFNVPNPAANRTITFSDPNGNDQVAYLSASQSLSAKTVTGPMALVTATGTISLTAAKVTRLLMVLTLGALTIYHSSCCKWSEIFDCCHRCFGRCCNS